MRRLAALVLILLALPGAAMAGDLVLSLSKSRITITSSFAGESIVLFGVIEAGDAGDDGQPYDVVVTVRGPNESFVTWRKERRFGLWVNVDSRSFLAAPSYLAVLSNREPSLMAPADILRQEQAGFVNNRLLQRVGSDFADVVPEDPFRQAFLRVKQAQGLYIENAAGVEFLAPHVFRAAFPIPGTAPIGTYEVVVKTFAGGAPVSRGAVRLDVGKVDFEQAVATAAQDHPWFYGLVTAFGALAVGFVANVAFRRD
ncbi:TIGR02186 family protein [Starkeya koreensis]|uniref:TIGR02186 family protein n=1 Tax=Ancylobacter koreensis TaxID=266121 RepID=A0ABT0DP88_9HYPH|nr:TIGR02186 family protein [Ancylobacter koreensis]MCK0209075.1 TIGR02186 family protein [Ancylobacter koreensis]